MLIIGILHQDNSVVVGRLTAPPDVISSQYQEVENIMEIKYPQNFVNIGKIHRVVQDIRLDRSIIYNKLLTLFG
jgi:hypothetical protein